MKRVTVAERPDWRDKAASDGFIFPGVPDDPYWDESVYYAFTLRQIEDDLEDPTEELHQMCLDLVDRAVASEEMLDQLRIPEACRDWIAASWQAREPSLYGRFDFAYDGTGPAKLLEYNADTPTGVYETGYFQWWWLTDAMDLGLIPRGCDQFNSLHDRLIVQWAEMGLDRLVHFACARDSAEDYATVEYLRDLAHQGGLATAFVYMDDIGIDADGHFGAPIESETDENAAIVIESLFKLYPWEWAFDDPYAKYLPTAGCRFVEPPWKAILSNKGILPLLWQAHPGHPNLLPAYFDGDPRIADLTDGRVRKPIFSREGMNVTIERPGQPPAQMPGPYGAEGFVVQAYHRPFQAGTNTAVIGSWIVGTEPAGMGIREAWIDITEDDARFLPHVILP